MASETKPLLQDAVGGLPNAPWVHAVRSTRDTRRYLPQTIAHRGYKASYPENTMGAFEGAVRVGAHAVETDLHLSSDGVVVLSHDPSLKRCYGVDKKINECDWRYLSTLRTLQDPAEGMPRLRDLLQWLDAPDRENIWVLLDIKIDDDAEDLVGVLARTLKEAPGSKPWNQRIVLGCWNATFIEASRRLLPSYPMAHISFFLPYSKHFFHMPNLGFNIFQRALVGPMGTRFMRKAQGENRPVFAWTVNEERWMKWCIKKNADEQRRCNGLEQKELEYSEMTGPKLIDGVITDDPKLFLEVCERWGDGQDGKTMEKEAGMRSQLAAWMQILQFQLLSPFFFLLLRLRGRLDYLTNPRRLAR